MEKKKPMLLEEGEERSSWRIPVYSNEEFIGWAECELLNPEEEKPIPFNTTYIQESDIRCSFCGLSSEEVKRMIAGPNVFICGECVELCIEIMKGD